MSGKILAFDELAAWRKDLRAAGKRLVVTNGVFDIMHRGHAEYLAQAAALGDLLLVLVNDDASVTALKGPTRPIQPQRDRAEMLAALACVGAVCIFRGPKADDALRAAAPDVYVKGGDYTPETLDRDEFAALQACGSQIKILPLVPGCSTSAIVKRILADQKGENTATTTANDRLMPIFRRRSIRSFLPREISQEEVARLLEAAMAAPSARAGYPAEFLVLSDRDQRLAAAECLPNGSFLKDAPLGILVCGDIDRACGNEVSYLLQDCAACVENLLLAASILGMGACWLGVHPRQERMVALRKHFRLPEKVIPVAAIAIGWTTESKPPRTNYQPEQVHLNRW